jgi:hypothetical protein
MNSPRCPETIDDTPPRAIQSKVSTLDELLAKGSDGR